MEVPGIGAGEVGDAVVTQGEGEAGVDEVAKGAGCFGCPVPERFGDFGFVVSKHPGGMGAQGVAEGGGFLGGLGFFENGGIAELHVDLDEHETAEQEAFAENFLLKETA